MTNSTYSTRPTLLRRARDPEDDNAWEDFVCYYQGFIQIVINKFLFETTDRDDLCQDILLKLWSRLKTYEENKSKFRTWLWVVIRNTVINHLRQKGRSPITMAPQGENLLYSAAENEVENLIVQEWETYAVNLALERIKPLFSEAALEIFELSLNNVSVGDIAQKLAMKADSAYKMKTRVIKRLQQEIALIRHETEF